MAQKSTTERIMAAARKLLDREGSDAVTMRRVAKMVGITPMAVYRHVVNRDDLLNVLADAGFADLATRLADASRSLNPEKRVMEILDVFLDFAFERPRMFELMFLERRKGARQYPRDFRDGKSPTAKFFAVAVEAGIKQDIFRDDDVWEIVFEMGAILHGLVMLYLGNRVEMPQEDFRALCHRTFWRYLNGILK
jgi:AcrR family transcriptional regulator